MPIGKLYGTAPSDVVMRVNTDSGDPTADFGPWPTGTSFTAWSAMSGGVQITTLWDEGQNPVAAVASNALSRTVFYGPDTHPGAIWLQDPSGVRWRFDPSDLANRVGGVTGVRVNGGPALQGEVALTVPSSSAGISDFVEAAQDAVAAAFAAGTHSGVTVNYNDATGALSLTVTIDPGTQQPGTGGTAADITVDTSGGLVGPNVQTALQDLYDRQAGDPAQFAPKTFN